MLPIYIVFFFFFLKKERFIFVFSTSLNCSWCCDHRETSCHYMFWVNLKNDFFLNFWHCLIKLRYIYSIRNLFGLFIFLYAFIAAGYTGLICWCVTVNVTFTVGTPRYSACKNTHVCIVFPVWLYVLNMTTQYLHIVCIELFHFVNAYNKLQYISTG